MPPSPPRRIPGGLTWVLVSAAALEFWVGGFCPPVPARERSALLRLPSPLLQRAAATTSASRFPRGRRRGLLITRPPSRLQAV